MLTIYDKTKLLLHKQENTLWQWKSGYQYPTVAIITYHT